MPPSPSEPEKYSIDEMMDRLKSGSPANLEDGELVTRSDGTQAIRVKKRKRRTSQPIRDERKSERKLRIFQVTAALILFFLLLFGGGGAIIYANSKPFREGLLRKIEETTGAKPEIEQFRMNPKTANAGKLTLLWPAGNPLKQLTLHAVSAEISPSSFFGKVMSGDEVTVVNGSLELQLPKDGEATRHFPAPAGSSSIKFNRYRIPAFQMTLGDEANPLIRLSKSEGSLNTESITGHSQLSLYKGDLTISNWPKLRLDRALVEFRGTETEVVGLRLLHETDSVGKFELAGTVFPTLPDRVSSLDVILESFEISGIVGPALGRLFSGRIDTQAVTKSNFLSFQPAQDVSTHLEVSFSLSPSSRMEMHRFPFLTYLAKEMADPWFQEPVFQSDATGEIARQGGGIVLQKILFESKARMACRGEIKLTPNQQLSGRLKIGIAEAMIVASKNTNLLALFGPQENGFRWIDLRIGGTAADPTDNFKELFETAKSKPRGVTDSIDDTGSTFEELTRPK